MPEFSASQLVNPDFNTEFNQAALQGVQRQQEVGGLNALQGVNLNDPQSVQNAMSNLIKTKNINAATSLLNFNRANMLQQYAYGKLTGQDRQSQQPQQGQVSTDINNPNGPQVDVTQPTPPIQLNGKDVDQKAALNHAAKINDELDNLSNLPMEQRKAYAMQIAPDLGFTAEQVANAPLDDEHIANLKHQVNAVTDHLNGNIQNMPQDYYTPQDLEAMSLMSGDPDKMAKAYTTAHPDMIPVPGLAGVVMNPRTGERYRVASPQEVAGQAGMTAGAQAQAQVGPHLQEKSGEAEIEDPRTQVEIKMPDGSVRQMNRRDAMALQAMHIPGVGQSQSTEAKAHDEAAGKTGGELDRGYGPGVNKVEAAHLKQEQTNLTSAAQEANKRLNSPQYDDTALTAKQIIGLGNSIGTGVYTKDLSDLFQKFAPMLPKSHMAQYATNTTLLSQDLSKAMKAQFAGSALPRIASEFNTITKAVPSNTSPQDTVKLYGALMLAKNNMEQDADRHLTQYQQNPTNGRSQTAAVGEFDKHRPDLLAYALPELQKMTINGKPAVEVRKFPDGTLRGMFLPGSKNSVQFYIGRTQ